jgi:hypothetical protein
MKEKIRHDERSLFAARQARPRKTHRHDGLLPQDMGWFVSFNMGVSLSGISGQGSDQSEEKTLESGMDHHLFPQCHQVFASQVNRTSFSRYLQYARCKKAPCGCEEMM